MATLTVKHPRRIPASEVALLSDAGYLPALPAHIAEIAALQPLQRAGIAGADLFLYDWFVVEQSARITGVMAAQTLDRDNAFQISHLVGSARAVYELVRYAQELCRPHDRRLIGSIDFGNATMARFLTRMGMRPTWVVFTGRP